MTVDLPTVAAPTVAELDLTSMIGSRICHDLISPIGAIGNGVELLSIPRLYEALRRM